MKALDSLRNHCKPYANTGEWDSYIQAMGSAHNKDSPCLYDIVFKSVWLPVGFMVWEQVRTQVRNQAIKTLKEGNTNGNV